MKFVLDTLQANLEITIFGKIHLMFLSKRKHINSTQ